MFTAVGDGYNCSLGHFRGLSHGATPQSRVACYQDALRQTIKNYPWSLWFFSDNLNKTKLEGNWGGKRFSEFLRDNGIGEVVESPTAPSSHGALSPPIQAWIWKPDHKKISDVLADRQFWTDLESEYAKQVKEASIPKDGAKPIGNTDQGVQLFEPIQNLPQSQPEAGRAAARKANPGYYWTQPKNNPTPWGDTNG